MFNGVPVQPRKAPNKARKAPRKMPAKRKAPTSNLDGDEEDESAPAPQTRRRRFKPGSEFITVIYHSKRLIITSCCTERDQKIAEVH